MALKPSTTNRTKEKEVNRPGIPWVGWARGVKLVHVHSGRQGNCCCCGVGEVYQRVVLQFLFSTTMDKIMEERIPP